MSEHPIQLSWKREGTFTYETYGRTHTVRFNGGATLKTTAAPEFMGKKEFANPEEMLAAALASCHMLTFLAIAAKSKHTIDSYEDNATAFLEKNEEGIMAVTRITLRPKVVFSGENLPDEAKIKQLHDKAGKHCFIEHSIRSKVNVEI